MQVYFDELSKLVEKHLFQLKILNETEQELALFFQQRGCGFMSCVRGVLLILIFFFFATSESLEIFDLSVYRYQEKDEAISTMSIDIGKAYSAGIKNRAALITVVSRFWHQSAMYRVV
jgi:hypothetical protein